MLFTDVYLTVEGCLIVENEAMHKFCRNKNHDKEEEEKYANECVNVVISVVGWLKTMKVKCCQ